MEPLIYFIEYKRRYNVVIFILEILAKFRSKKIMQRLKCLRWWIVFSTSHAFVGMELVYTYIHRRGLSCRCLSFEQAMREASRMGKQLVGSSRLFLFHFHWKEPSVELMEEYEKVWSLALVYFNKCLCFCL